MAQILVRLSVLLVLVACAAHAETALVWPDGTTTIRKALGEAVAAKDAASATIAARRLSEVGGSLSAGSQEAVAALIGDAMTPIRAVYAANAKPVEASTVEAQVPAEYALVEGIAVDPVSSRLFISTVVGRALAYRDGGRFKKIEIADAGSLFGMAVDTPRRLLWIASGKVAQTPRPETAFSGLIAVNLDTLLVAARIAAPVAMKGALGDVAVAGDGTIYAANGETGEVLRCLPGCSELTTFVPAGLLRSAQGMAISPDGNNLVIADYGYGLAAVDVTSGVISALQPPRGIPIDGVDGLVGDGDRLFAIQNGLRPFRITEFTVSKDGRHVLGARVLERAHIAWGEPTLGAIAGSGLVYVSNAGWENFKDGGVYTGPEPRTSTVLRRLDPGGK